MRKGVVAAVVVVLAGLVGVCGVSGSAYAVSCPAGTLRGDKGETANSLAECNIDSSHDSDNLMQTVDTIFAVVFGILGIVAVAVIIIGGVSFITSQGDAAKVTKGKNTILYGVIGLIIALLAFVIVNFVLSAVFKPSSSTGSGGQQNSSDQQQTGP